MFAVLPSLKHCYVMQLYLYLYYRYLYLYLDLNQKWSSLNQKAKVQIAALWACSVILALLVCYSYIICGILIYFIHLL